MPAPNRINFLSLFCSCVGHAAILGGIIYGLADHDRDKPGPKDARAPLVVELLALDSAEGAASRGAKRAVESEHSRIAAPIPAGSGHRSAQPADPSVAAVLASESAGGGAIAPGGSEAEGARAVSSPADFSDYQRRLYQALARCSRYPAEARRLNLSGVTQLAFRLDRLGRVLDSWIQESSGSELLDAAALEALDRAQPLPPIPLGLPSRMEFVIEIDLSVTRQFASRAAGQK